MRLSDALIYNWGFLWAANMLSLKLLDLVGCFFTTRRIDGFFSILVILSLSVAFSLAMIVVALLVDVMVNIRIQPSLVIDSKDCRGGICWHNVHSHRLSGGKLGFM
ncbi:hypothetical protein LguiA_013956 [Lonicera macranthoides]